MAGDQLAGRWRRRMGRDTVDVEVLLTDAPTPAGRVGLDDAVARYAAFLGRDPNLVLLAHSCCRR